MCQTDTIYAERKISCNVPAVVSDLKAQMKLIPFTHQFAGGGKSGALRIMNLNLQFAAVPLGGSWKNTNQQQSEKSDSLCKPCHHCVNSL